MTIEQFFLRRFQLQNFYGKNIPFHKENINIEADYNLADIVKNAFNAANISGSVVDISFGPVISRVFFKLDNIKDIAAINSKNVTDIVKSALAKGNQVNISPDFNKQSTVAVDIPNDKRQFIPFGNCFDKIDHTQKLPVAIGVDTMGNPISFDITSAPHMLIAGATGSGKSVCINSIIMSLVANLNPDCFRLLLIDPKKVEFAPYRLLKTIYEEVTNEPKYAVQSLQNLVDDMEYRFDILAKAGVRKIEDFNKKILNSEPIPDISADEYRFMPYVVAVIDEFADLMMTKDENGVCRNKEVETLVCRIAQKARAVGIHLVIATQRPSVNVITGVIKANIPTRIVFKVASAVDSKIMIGQAGAETLLGKGDGFIQDDSGIRRFHGCFLSDDEIRNIVNRPAFCRKNEKEYVSFAFGMPFEYGGKYIALAFFKRYNALNFKAVNEIKPFLDWLAGLYHSKDHNLLTLTDPIFYYLKDLNETYQRLYGQKDATREVASVTST